MMPASDQQYFSVLLPLMLEEPYTYAAPLDMQLSNGDAVLVPLGKRVETGIIWAVNQAAPRPPMGSKRNFEIKSILEKRDMPPLPPLMRRFIEWVSAYTLSPKGMVLRMALREESAAFSAKIHMGVRASGKTPARMSEARRKLLAAAGTELWQKSALLRAAEVSASSLESLIDEGVFDLTPLLKTSIPPDPDFITPRLNADQTSAANILTAQAHIGFSVTLLEGVTGSGKTEVYFEAIAETLRAGRQVLVLLPEIALSGAFHARFAARFGTAPLAWHSRLSENKRNQIWQDISEGTPVVVGARSALFCPFQNLGLIIVDEEHDQSYKQEDHVRYHARDMAIARARLEKAMVVLASATPALETRENATSGKFKHILLPRRFNEQALPGIRALDLVKNPPPKGQWLSPLLIDEVQATLQRGEQALLFLNRRGYAPLTLCAECGYRWQCPQCTASLTEHRFRAALLCHHCGYMCRKPMACTACGAEDGLISCGPGIERLSEEAHRLFPKARIECLSSDVPGGIETLNKQLDAITSGEVNLIIGTQLIAKGHNFPHLTLVVVVDADLGLMNADPRASERSFQILQQVTGRAGRAEKTGRGILQTYQPNHPVMKALLTGDTEAFYEAELTTRAAAILPPYARLASLIVSGTIQSDVEKAARFCARFSHTLQNENENYAKIQCLGPAEAPLLMLRGQYRYRLLYKSPRENKTPQKPLVLQEFLRAVILEASVNFKSIRFTPDIDPMSFM